MKSICLEFCLIKIHEGLVAESSRNIGGNVADARLRGEGSTEREGWGFLVSLLIVCVCVFAFACLSVCLF